MDKLFYADPGKEQRFSYRYLSRMLSAQWLEYVPYCYTDDTFEVFRHILVSLILDRELTLLDADFSAAELKGLLADSGIVNHRERVRNPCAGFEFEALLDKIASAEQWRLFLFTSGTTGVPKKIAHSFKTLTRAVRKGGKFEENVWGFAYNPTHIAGVQVFLQAFLNCNSLVNIFGLNRQKVLQEIDKYKITNISATPTFYRLLLPFEKPHDTLLRVTSGGEKLDGQLLVRLQSIFPNAKFLNVYASTEAGTIFAAEGDVFALPDKFAEWVRIQGDELQIHQSLLGESAAVMLQDGWYHTGDIVDIISQDPLRFRFVRRQNEMINVGGYKVNPAEVEDTIRKHEKVADVQVYAVENSVTGSILECNIVSIGPDLSSRDLRKFLQPRLQSYKIPRLMNFVESLEVTSTGKVKRT